MIDCSELGDSLCWGLRDRLADYEERLFSTVGASAFNLGDGCVPFFSIHAVLRRSICKLCKLQVIVAVSLLYASTMVEQPRSISFLVALLVSNDHQASVRQADQEAFAEVPRYAMSGSFL
jgi:hypothetical protein